MAFDLLSVLQPCHSCLLIDHCLRHVIRVGHCAATKMFDSILRV